MVYVNNLNLMSQIMDNNQNSTPEKNASVNYADHCCTEKQTNENSRPMNKNQLMTTNE